MEEPIYYLYTDKHTFIELVRNDKKPYHEYKMVFVDGKLGFFELDSVGFFINEPTNEAVLKKLENYLFLNSKGSRKIIEWLLSSDRFFN